MIKVTRQQVVREYFSWYSQRLGATQYLHSEWGVLATLLWKDGVSIEKLCELTNVLSKNKRFFYSGRSLDIKLGKKVRRLTYRGKVIPHFDLPPSGFEAGGSWGLSVLFNTIPLTEDNIDMFRKFLMMPIFGLRRTNISRIALGMPRLSHL